MDSNEKSLEEFFYPFSWKTPLIYIILCIAIGLYIYIFFIRYNNEVFGTIERLRGVKLFLVFFTMQFVFFPFLSSHFVESVESLFLRGLLLLGAFSLAILFVAHMGWTYNEYDNQKMNAYRRIFPFKNSPYLETGSPLIYSNIKAIKYSQGGGDDSWSLEFKLNDGRRRFLDINNISGKSEYMFLLTLYKECDWLQADIEKRLSPLKKYVEREEKKSINIDSIIIDLVCIFSIFISLMEFICLILYTFKIKI
ncbi:hypothetical protein AGMMS49587_10240 [Spirochaetia bacterium]|nr:hypothetical protein AGMMS49587_10240 [Spirochaetia bacterium]